MHKGIEGYWILNICWRNSEILNENKIVQMGNSKGISNTSEIWVVCIYFTSYKICLGAELKFTFVLSMRKQFGSKLF